MTELCTYLVEFDRVTISTKNVFNKLKFMTILNLCMFPHRGAILREIFRTVECEPGVETCRSFIQCAAEKPDGFQNETTQ